MAGGDEPSEPDNCCAVCLSAYTLKTKTSCGHYFCCSCILQVLNHHDKRNNPFECPYCKQLVKFLRTDEPGCYVLPCLPELDDRAAAIMTKNMDMVRSLSPHPDHANQPFPILRFLLRTFLAANLFFFVFLFVSVIDIIVLDMLGSRYRAVTFAFLFLFFTVFNIIGRMITGKGFFVTLFHNGVKLIKSLT